MTKFEKTMEGAGGVLLLAFAGWVAYRVKQGIDWKNGKGSGVGAVRAKRRVYAEMADMQHAGVQLGRRWANLTDEEQRIVERQAAAHNFSGSSRSGKTVAEQYYNSIQRAYGAISGTNLPYHESVVLNENGDEIIRYRDYGTEAQRHKDAYAWYEDQATRPYDYVLLYLADGGKLKWTGKKEGERGVKQIVFPSRTNSEEERKARFSYLSSKGLSPEMLAHQIWEGHYFDDGRYDSQDALDAVAEAVLNIESRGEAQRIIQDAYLDAHRAQDVPDEVLPF